MIMIKYITTQEFNNLVAENFTAKLVQANLVSINDIANVAEKIDFYSFQIKAK